MNALLVDWLLVRLPNKESRVSFLVRKKGKCIKRRTFTLSIQLSFVLQVISMKSVFVWCMLSNILSDVSGYWDTGTTTLEYKRTDTVPRQSFFRWQITQPEYLSAYFYNWDWPEIRRRRRLNVVAGISIDMLNLGVASLLNKRTLITSANYLDPWLNRQRDLRIWALGRQGDNISPYRYRVWRVTRLFPKSLNPNIGMALEECTRRDTMSP
ncbi:hypothetical protein SFRURICE_006842 [Spodoptera frugiperda]|nr:hypothetical protein SFRURICE_006842 [Spodoptera frugiperda]